MAPSDNLRSSRRRKERAVSDDDYEDSFADDSSSDSDSEFEQGIFLGLTMSQLQGKSESRGRANWPEELKTAVFVMAISLGFSAKNLPSPEVLIDVCTRIGLPLDCGKRVAASCIKKLVSWIENNIPPKGAGELIDYKLVPKYNKPVWEIHISAALASAVQREEFSFSRDILGGVVRADHARRRYTHHDVLNPSTIGSGTLQKKTMSLLIARGLITKESGGKLGTHTTSDIAYRAGGRLNTAPAFQQTVPGLVTLSPYAAHYVGQAHSSTTPLHGVPNHVTDPSWAATPQSESYGSGPGISSAGPSSGTSNAVTGSSHTNHQSAVHGAGFAPSSAAVGHPNSVTRRSRAAHQSARYDNGLGQSSAPPAPGYTNANTDQNFSHAIPTTPAHAPAPSDGNRAPAHPRAYATPRAELPYLTDGHVPTTPPAPQFPSIFSRARGYNVIPTADVPAHGNAYPTPTPSGSRYQSPTPIPSTPTPAPTSMEREELLNLRKLVAKMGIEHVHGQPVEQETVAGPSRAPQTTPYQVSDNTDENWSDPPHYLQQSPQGGNGEPTPAFRNSTRDIPEQHQLHQMPVQSMPQSVQRTPHRLNESLATTLASCPAVPAQDPAHLGYASPTAARTLEPAYLADYRPLSHSRPPTAFTSIASPVPTRQQPGTSSYSQMPGQYQYSHPPVSQQVPHHFPSTQAPLQRPDSTFR